jgi:predicted flap endonuclease-1-like 5' DNA nuclease
MLIRHRKHGTFRPSLAKLVASNSPEDIKTATQNAFAVSDISNHPRDSLNHLTKLKGVGPATASLVLSCHDPQNLPFASDELFRWLHWDGKNSEGKTDGIKQVGKGWSRAIGYTPKEYVEMCARNNRVRKRLAQAGRAVSSLEMEKVAYVLGKEQVDIDQSDETAKLEEQTPSAATEASLKASHKDGTKPQTKEPIAKRVAKSDPSDDGPRRSKRGKQS